MLLLYVTKQKFREDGWLFRIRQWKSLSSDGISKQGRWVTINSYKSFYIHLLYILGHHPDNDHFIRQYFLPQEYAIFLLVWCGASLLLMHIYWICDAQIQKEESLMQLIFANLIFLTMN
ncbi:hypothetical protein FEM48_Zijuj11G0145500 [Ziziphus jujuba var. spinosa]|uniref:Uncharacterized protein n=1 Tax=Ziziphus jujuba var. spinosa TaxID=714518 RepID=A0A978UJH7_ZIZJJ|nr:hypothetical protein FEM48_Zijuj11G0145500 [Ziziphus jujuba var. spinosa]